VIYSVYNHNSKSYDYFEGSGPAGTHADAPPAPPLQHKTGASPAAAAWRLPWGAKKIGSGELPRGRIASSGISLGGLGDITSDLPAVGLAVGIAYLAWRHFR
jgi:hypothetical protein